MGVKKSGWGSLMKHEEHRQEIEPSVLALGAVFAATLLGMILWTISSRTAFSVGSTGVDFVFGRNWILDSLIDREAGQYDL